jgi:hypothetical protein
VAGSVWRAVCGGWGMIGGRKHDVGQCHSLNLIFGALTATGSHDLMRVIVRVAVTVAVMVMVAVTVIDTVPANT